jgi:hypothetical protein
VSSLIFVKHSFEPLIFNGYDEGHTLIFDGNGVAVLNDSLKRLAIYN